MNRITDDKNLLTQINNVVAGAMFDFMGWLTTRDERLVLSSTDNASPAAEAIIEFLKMRQVHASNPSITDWQQLIQVNNDLEEGFYLLSNPKEPRVSLVRVYTCGNFKDQKHVAFGPWDGAAVMPLSDLTDDSKLTPITVSLSDKPINDLNILLE